MATFGETNGLPTDPGFGPGLAHLGAGAGAIARSAVEVGPLTFVLLYAARPKRDFSPLV